MDQNPYQAMTSRSPEAPHVMTGHGMAWSMLCACIRHKITNLLIQPTPVPPIQPHPANMSTNEPSTFLSLPRLSLTQCTPISQPSRLSSTKMDNNIVTWWAVMYKVQRCMFCHAKHICSMYGGGIIADGNGHI